MSTWILSPFVTTQTGVFPPHMCQKTFCKRWTKLNKLAEGRLAQGCNDRRPSNTLVVWQPSEWQWPKCVIVVDLKVIRLQLQRDKRCVRLLCPLQTRFSKVVIKDHSWGRVFLTAFENNVTADKTAVCENCLILVFIYRKCSNAGRQGPPSALRLLM